MHKDEQVFNLYASLQQLVTYVPTIFNSQSSDGGNTQQQVLRVAHSLPVTKWAPQQQFLYLPSQLSLNYVAKPKSKLDFSDYSTCVKDLRATHSQICIRTKVFSLAL